MNTIKVFNTLTRRYENVMMDDTLCLAYKRTGWDIENSNARFYKHEIQISCLKCNPDGGWENFDEFISSENNPEEIIEEKSTLEKLRKSLCTLSLDEQKLVEALFFMELTERECAVHLGIPQTTVHYRKTVVLKKIKKILES